MKKVEKKTKVTLSSFVSFQPLQPAVMNDFLCEINACVVPSQELLCSEYCFRQCVNPFQHPSFDKNIHHLTALLKALTNTCGGVVQLSVHGGTVVGGREQLTSYTSQLLAMTGISENLVKIYPGGDNTPWALIAAKNRQDIFFSNSGNSSVKLRIDINGQLLQEDCKQTGEGQEVSNQPDEALGENGAQDRDSVQKRITDVDGSPPPNRSKLSTTEKDEEVDVSQTPVEFSTELNWDTNKKNWDEILGEAKTSTDEYIASCEVWEPRKPMQVTPDRDSLKYLFPSDDACEDTISRLETQTPGFAIASRSWTSLLPQLDIQRPMNHLCDILTVAKSEGLEVPQPSICLWVIVSRSTEQVIQEQLQYMFIVGRAIKHQLSNQDREVTAVAIRCMLHSTHPEDNDRIEKNLQESGIQHMQEFLCSTFKGMGTFDSVKRCMALLLLTQESPIKTCAGHQLSVKLSANQAKELLKIKSKKVAYVSSAPGTGKTFCGLALYGDFGKERSVYICPTEPLLHYLRYNGCEATLVRNDKDLYQHMTGGTFDNKVCVIIDESHRLRCSKESLRELFIFMKKHRMRLFVFGDNAYQSFDRENQLQIQTCICELSKEVWGRPPYEPILTEIFRNTRKVVSFLVQHAMGDPDSDSDNDDVPDISCGNIHEGDGVQCIAMENLVDNSSDNGLVQYLRPLLDTRYRVTEVAVLLDIGYTDDHINAVHQVLQTYIPRVSTHSAATFPREGIIVDRVESFAGLDAALCIFLLSIGTATDPDATIENARYRVYLASRATHKAVFIVPRIDADIVQHMKFDYFQVSFILIIFNEMQLKIIS